MYTNLKGKKTAITLLSFAKKANFSSEIYGRLDLAIIIKSENSVSLFVSFFE